MRYKMNYSDARSHKKALFPGLLGLYGDWFRTSLPVCYMILFIYAIYLRYSSISICYICIIYTVDYISVLVVYVYIFIAWLVIYGLVGIYWVYPGIGYISGILG